MMNCEFKSNEKMQAWYEEKYPKMSADISVLKLAKPALRALIDNDVYSLKQLSKYREEQFNGFHGIGPNAAVKIKSGMKKAGIGFKIK